MFHHPRLWLIALWASSVAGAVVILNLTLGHYRASTFLCAALAGLAISGPAALLNWAYLRLNRVRQVGVLGQAPTDRP